MELPNSKMLKHEERDTRDRISELSDDVLVKILSFLPSEEAVLKTSFLSHRWKQLWESLPVSFNFDGLMPVRYGAYAKSFEDSKDCRSMTVEDRKRERCKFVGWVNDVLIAHQGSTIDEFRVRFYLDHDSRTYIDKWIEIAMKKKVKKLELDFPYLYPCSRLSYRLPQESFCGIEFLSSLCLKYVSASDDVMEWILSNCPMLENLHIEGSPLLRHPKVSGSSLRLKHLHISKCLYIRSVEISAPNLVSLEYHREERLFTLHIMHAPKLVELYYSSRHYCIDKHVSRLSNYLPQLMTLRLSMELPLHIQQFPTCTNLRHLSCKLTIHPGNRLFSLRSLIESSPFLHKFTLEITGYSTAYVVYIIYVSEILNKIENYNKIKNKLRKARKVVEGPPHKYLKQLEVIGFLRQPMEAKFVAYLLKSAINLEKIVIHTGFLDRKKLYSKKLAETTHQKAHELAHQLMEHRPEAELVLL